MPNLSERVEELAANIVLGGADCERWAVLLAGVRQEAETAGRADVARIAAEALDVLSKGSDASGMESACSRSIVLMQQALAEGGARIAASGVAAQSATPSAPAILSIGEDPELIGDFILESRDHLTQVEIQMMTLEKDPGEREAINTVFRAFHTIKGLAGFMDLNDIREVAHETETLLDLARNQKLRITSAVVDLVLAAADFLKVWLKRIETTLAGSDAGPAPEKLALLERIRRGALGESDVAVAVTEADEGAGAAAADLSERRKTPAADWTGPERRSGDGDRRTQGSETRSVKVDTAKLDYLVDMAGEMVIAQSTGPPSPGTGGAAQTRPSCADLAQLSRIPAEVQKTAMAMRMVPIGGLFHQMAVWCGIWLAKVRQARPRWDRRRGNRAGPQHGGGTGGPADAHGPQCHRPRPRRPGRRAARAGKDPHRPRSPPRQPPGGAYRH